VTSVKEEIFGKILEEERKAKNISQEKLAKLTGLDRTAISLIENGKRSPTFTGLAHAARGASPDERQTPLTLLSYRPARIVKPDFPFLPSRSVGKYPLD